MKATGGARKVDNLGRIVIPREIRKTFGIKEKIDALEIFTEGNTIILKKYEPICIFCGEGKNVISFKNKKICEDCLKEIKKTEI